MILHTARRTAESSARQVVVATDIERIYNLCVDAGIKFEMTLLDHISGTDRVTEVVARRGWRSGDFVVGLQAMNQLHWQVIKIN